MARKEDDEWLDEIKQREDFVLDENFSSFHDDDEVTYRRAPDMGGTTFVSARFDALEEELAFHPTTMKASTKLSPSFVSPFQAEPLEAETKAVEKDSREVEPTQDVPIAYDPCYNDVSPMFESEESASVVFHTLKEAVAPYVEEYQCFHDWSIKAFAMVAAEEINFSIQLYRVHGKGNIRVHFDLLSGDELQFLEITDKIRGQCCSIDADMSGIPNLGFDICTSWSSHEELYPGSLTANQQDLRLLLDDITAAHVHPSTRYHAVKQLKTYCQTSSNRETLCRSMKERLVAALDQMLHDSDEDVVRFGIYVILTFAQDQAAWTKFNFPALPTILSTVGKSVQKRSTKKLANDLHSAIARVGVVAVGGGAQH